MNEQIYFKAVFFVCGYTFCDLIKAANYMDIQTQQVKAEVKRVYDLLLTIHCEAKIQAYNEMQEIAKRHAKAEGNFLSFAQIELNDKK